MPPDADIVVVGAGIVGIATARALAGYAGKALLLEQFELGHAHGSSHGTSRIFRLNYPDERFVRLALAADSAWRELEAERGERLIDRVGSLDLGPVAIQTSRALAACGVRSETLSADEVRERWPLLLEAGETAVFQPDGGVTYADRAYKALLAGALEGGGLEVRTSTPVRSLSLGRGAVQIELDGGVLTARAVVVVAGAWAPELLAPVGIDLAVVPTRETVVYVDVPEAGTIPALIDYGRLPSPSEGGARAGLAGYALAAPGQGLKAGLHHSGPAVVPGSTAEPDEFIAAWTREWVASRYERAGERLGADTCLYTNTADDEFVLERHGRVVVGSACSGHGFKFAPLVGRTLAALAREAAD